MERQELIEYFGRNSGCRLLLGELAAGYRRLQLDGLKGSSASLTVAFAFNKVYSDFLIILQDKESAAYFLNDLENLMDEVRATPAARKVLFFPSAFRRSGDFSATDAGNVLLRTEVMNRLLNPHEKIIVVTYPEALGEKVVPPEFYRRRSLMLKKGEEYSVELLGEILNELHFDRVDFVVEPGQYAIRGGIVDVFSFAHDNPFRIEFSGDIIESLRTFEPVSQLSVEKLEEIKILPDAENPQFSETKVCLTDYFNGNAIIWTDDAGFVTDRVENNFQKACLYYDSADDSLETAASLFADGGEMQEKLGNFTIIEFGRPGLFQPDRQVNFRISPQPSFNKNFNLLLSQLEEYSRKGYHLLILSDTESQLLRIETILRDLMASKPQSLRISCETELFSLREGFIDHDSKLLCFTDHQIFDRYYRFRLRDSYPRREAITLKEILDLKPGDYVTHVDHGIGRYGGLEKIEVNGKQQEAVRIIYQNNDLLYVSIHSLHRIAKYAGKDGSVPSLSRLGSNAWNRLKNRTKQKVKDIAKDLIQLYARRKASEGFAFSPDSYLQAELEASFIYEDTPDQIKATADVKKDMENPYPMDRLICGDVGFGKTEVAVRAAFKAVADNKQVAFLVPTTILALQHYNTLTSRLMSFPCRVEYLNRFRSAAKQKEILREVEEGKIDILIGTHRILGKDVKFKDLGLLIIDEEQKFGVAAKEKLKNFRVNVDTLTLTATPIPRTLQFSLMGARDLSVINTPPANRYPVQTQLHVFNEDVIRDAIQYEISRGGQVFLVHNRVHNINDVADLVRKLCPHLRVAVAHGQMHGKELEQTMLEFIEGNYDVLVATTIIESGLDIPNVNTIIINDAHHFGLSDLHQLRGRVGRSNVKAFCYLLAPPLSLLTEEARKRLKAIEEFSDLGSGFNISLRDLDIRGAGNILGAEQSGFITEIGFEMYHKILDEAIQELKESEFRELYKEELREKPFVRDCHIETDLEILIPDNYVESIHERLNLYKELDNIEEEEGLLSFEKNLADRFGPVPDVVKELINTVRLRWFARKIGLEKIYLRENKFTGYFVSNPDSAFYHSEIFNLVLHFVRDFKGTCRMKESHGKLSLVIGNIDSVSKALEVLSPLCEQVQHLHHGNLQIETSGTGR